MAAPLFNPGLFDQNTTVLVTPATTTNQPLEHENYIGMTCASTLQTGGTYSDSVGSSTSFPTFAPSTVKLDGEEILWDNAGHNGTTRMRCPRCQTWVATGSRRVVLHSLRAHMGGISAAALALHLSIAKRGRMHRMLAGLYFPHFQIGHLNHKHPSLLTRWHPSLVGQALCNGGT